MNSYSDHEYIFIYWLIIYDLWLMIYESIHANLYYKYSFIMVTLNKDSRSQCRNGDRYGYRYVCRYIYYILLN